MARNAAGLAFLAQPEDDVRKVAFRHGVDHIGRSWPGCAHAHVERAVLHEGKAALAFIDLEARDADIEHDAVDHLMPGIVDKRVHLAEPAKQRCQARCFSGQFLGAQDGIQIPVDGQHAALGREEDGARITAAAERAVNDPVAVLRAKPGKHFVQHDRPVAGSFRPG